MLDHGTAAFPYAERGGRVIMIRPVPVRVTAGCMNPVLVTGSTDGIGLAAVTLLAADKHPVIVQGRDPAKGAAAVAALRARYPGVEINLVTADLRDSEAIAAIPDEIRDRYEKLDALVNNAGVFMPNRVLTAEGLETTFAVNGLAPYRVTRALAPLLNSQRRVVFVASIAHFSTETIDWENLQGERRTTTDTRPTASPARERVAGQRFRRPRLRSRLAHPGVCDTEAARDRLPPRQPGRRLRLLRHERGQTCDLRSSRTGGLLRPDRPQPILEALPADPSLSGAGAGFQLFE